MRKTKLKALNRFLLLMATCFIWNLASAQDQNITVTGTVTDPATKEPIIGAVVAVKGTTTATTTDIDGKYTIQAPPTGTLVISYAGYAEQEIAVGNAGTHDVSLAEDVQSLKEVVAIGYGTQEKTDVTGSISTIKSRDISVQPVASLDQALQGRAAGVQVQTNSGAPGGGISIRIRGQGTTNNSEPLYVIDGMPIVNNSSNNDGFAIGTSSANQSSNPLATINPQDIESIDVLKDASATAIYGSRAANGVVLITTKRGKSGKPVLTFDTYHGIQSVVRKIPVLNAEQFATYANRMNALYPTSTRVNSDWANPAALGKGTDWQDELFRQAAIHNYQLSLQGGNDVSKYAVSGGLFQQDGVIVGTDFKRYSFRVNTDHQVTKRLKVGNSFNLSRSEETVVNTEDPANGVVANALKFQPTWGPRNPDGSWRAPNTTLNPNDANLTSTVANPVLTAEYVVQNKIERNRILGGLYGEFEFFKGLKFRSNFNIDMLNSQQHIFEPSITIGNFSRPNARTTEFRANDLNWLTENLLSYDRKIGKSSFNILVGGTAQNYNYNNTNIQRTGFLTNEIHNISNGSGVPSVGGTLNSWSLASFLGRVVYAYDNKYLLTATIRRDASSRFPSANQWATFPSVSLGWRLSEESFIKDNIAIISNLKLRGGWGTSGNQEIGNYPYQSSLGAFNYTLGDKALAAGTSPQQLANSKIKWEQVTMTNIGLDLGLIQNRIIFSADYYVKNTNDLLLQKALPAVSGFGQPDLTGNYLFNPTLNLGKIKNSGIELSLGTRNTVGAFKWNTDLVFSKVSNKVTYLTEDPNYFVPNVFNYNNTNVQLTRTIVGQPVASFYGLVTDGIFQNAAEVDAHADQEGAAPGDIRFKDLDGSGKIDDNDRTYLGSGIPKFTYGINNNFSFKGFDLSIFFSGVQGNKVFNTQKFFLGQYNASSTAVPNVGIEALDAWSGEGTSNTTPRLTSGDPNGNASKVSDRFIENGSYFRLKNVSLGYNIPTDLVKKIGLGTLRIYASGANLFTITDYSGYDPEVGSYQQSALFNGVDLGRYPVSRVYTVGLTVGF